MSLSNVHVALCAICRWTVVTVLRTFVLLQFLDLLTTLAVLGVGGAELNPLVRSLFHLGPAAGLVAAKLMVVGIALMILWVGRPRALLLANRFYACVIVWNLANFVGQAYTSGVLV